MGSESWLILLGILVAFILLAVFVVRSEEATYYYQCYNQNTYSHRAYAGLCKGIPNAEKCIKCPYHKRYERSQKK